MVGWFPSGGGDHAGTVYRYNQITSSYATQYTWDRQGLFYGVIVGHEPWSHPENDRFVSNAGSVVDNDITGATINLAIDGIGDGYIHGNEMSAPWNYQYFDYCHPHVFNPWTPLGIANYTAHFFGAASIQSGWGRAWVYAAHCGIWDDEVPQPDNAGAMIHSRYLYPDEMITSENGNYHLVYQTDGNLVLYDATDNQNWVALWSSGTNIYSAGFAVMQSDGNLVVYDSGMVARFNTESAGNEGAYLVVQSDGNLVLYALDGTVLWTRHDQPQSR